MNAAPAAASPATGRALISAWNSHVCAHRSHHATYASTLRESAPAATLGSEVGIGAEHDPGGARLGHDREHLPRVAVRGLGGVGAAGLVHEQHVDVATRS